MHIVMQPQMHLASSQEVNMEFLFEILLTKVFLSVCMEGVHTLPLRSYGFAISHASDFWAFIFIFSSARSCIKISIQLAVTLDYIALTYSYSALALNYIALILSSSASKLYFRSVFSRFLIVYMLVFFVYYFI